MKNLLIVGFCAIDFCVGMAGRAQVHGRQPSVLVQDEQWPTYGGDAGGQRYAASAQINRENVRDLQVAWTFHTGNKEDGSFEATPILLQGTLYVTAPRDQVFALDPDTGVQRWSFDPQLASDRNLGIITSRGVAGWSSGALTKEGGCADRIFLGTLDGRLISLDAATGHKCNDFGEGGSVDLTRGVDYRVGDDYAVTSPPTVVGDVVVVGAGIEDNARVDVERGDVRGYDVRTGKLRWTWVPIPWADHQKVRTGAANVWGVMAADLERGLIYLPVSSPSPDYYGGTRLGNNQDADSIVALDAKSGKKIWAYQIVHHDIWDYDLAAEPLLFTFRGATPAIAVATKMGQVFVFNRLTGEPLYPIEERLVPQSDVPGEVTSPTQPYSSLPMMSPSTLDLSKPLGITAEDDASCRALFKGLRYDGMYTPISLRGSIEFPSNIGGVNWGSMAIDPETGILYANTNREPYFVRLEVRPLLTESGKLFVAKVLLVAVGIVVLVLGGRVGGKPGFAVAAVCVLFSLLFVGLHRNQVRARFQNSAFLNLKGPHAAHFGMEEGVDSGTHYVFYRQPIQINGRPCAPMPWGTVSALNLNTGKATWQTALGTLVEGEHTGTLSVGGPIVTGGGLVFTAASEQAYLRAFSAATGEELWKAKLPAPAQSTPMSYVTNGRQMIVIAAGGHPGLSEGFSDSLVAYSVPKTEGASR